MLRSPHAFPLLYQILDFSLFIKLLCNISVLKPLGLFSPMYTHRQKANILAPKRLPTYKFRHLGMDSGLFLSFQNMSIAKKIRK